MTLLFIDGPLAQECIGWPDAPPTFQISLPKRITICTCNPHEWPEEFEYAPEIFLYHRVLVGVNIAIYSKYREDTKVIDSLKVWVATDLSKDWHINCRERRAWQ